MPKIQRLVVKGVGKIELKKEKIERYQVHGEPAERTVSECKRTPGNYGKDDNLVLTSKSKNKKIPLLNIQS